MGGKVEGPADNGDENQLHVVFDKGSRWNIFPSQITRTKSKVIQPEKGAIVLCVVAGGDEEMKCRDEPNSKRATRKREKKNDKKRKKKKKAKAKRNAILIL